VLGGGREPCPEPAVVGIETKLSCGVVQRDSETEDLLCWTRKTHVGPGIWQELGTSTRPWMGVGLQG
jgi:hypothetical protein